MADKTGIEWTDSTWNPIRGCSRVSEGCRNCYAEGVAKRFSGDGQPYAGLIARGGQWNGRIKIVNHLLDWPLRKRKPMRIFVNSMSDLFHESVPDWVIDRIFAVMAIAERHTFQVLTKRPKRMRDYLSQDRRTQWADSAVRLWGGTDPDALYDAIDHGDNVLPNVWLGASVEDQATADVRIPLLLQTPAAVRWISAEPLLGPIDIDQAMWGTDPDKRGPMSCFGFTDGFGYEALLHWVVVGGESGRNARPMHPKWARSLRDQCEAAGVAFLFKQWGGWVPGDAPPWPENADYAVEAGKGFYFDDLQWMDRVGKKTAGRHLDGIIYDQYPR